MCAPVDGSQPLVSVVTPCYNQAGFLDQTIQSVLTQGYPHIEHIVIDGGSTDGSIEVIRRYEDRLTHWVCEPDRGQADAINKGLRMAKGQIIGWLNSDDLYYPDTIGTVVRLFQEHPQALLIYGDAVLVDETGQFVRYFTEVESFDAFRLRSCANFIMQPTAFFRRQALDEAGLLDPQLQWCLDWDLWCRIADLGPVHHKPVLLAANRSHAQTKTQTGGRRRLAEIWRVQQRHRCSRWPHAFFSYLTKELMGRSRAAPRPWNRLGWWVLAAATAPGGMLNVLHAQRHRRMMGGLAHGSHACQEHVRVRFPLFRPAQAVELLLRSHGAKRKVRARINGDLQPVQTLGGSSGGLVLELPASVHNEHVLDLEIEFEPTPTRTGVFLEHVRLL